MPTFQGQVNEDQLNQLIAYIKSLSSGHPRVDKPRTEGRRLDTSDEPGKRSIGMIMATAAVRAPNGRITSTRLWHQVVAADPDHKRIALLYLISITALFFIGGFFALLIRLELLTPAGDLFHADTYNKLFTMHGQIMVFFFLIPSIPGRAGKFRDPADDRRQGSGVSAHQSAELVHVHRWRPLRCTADLRAASILAGPSTRPSAPPSAIPMSSRPALHLHRRVSLPS